MLNLISNTVKFTDQASVTGWADGGEKESADRGQRHRHGHPPDEQEMIFDEFRHSERRRGEDTEAWAWD